MLPQFHQTQYFTLLFSLLRYERKMRPRENSEFSSHMLPSWWKLLLILMCSCCLFASVNLKHTTRYLKVNIVLATKNVSIYDCWAIKKFAFWLWICLSVQKSFRCESTFLLPRHTHTRSFFRLLPELCFFRRQ